MQALPDPGSVAAAMHSLGECYRAMGLYEQALPLVHQALALRYEVLGLEHPLVAASMHTLGELHQESLMAVENAICAYIRIRTGDPQPPAEVPQAPRLYNAAAEIAQETRLYLCGSIRAQTGDANTTAEVTQQILCALLRAGFAKYDPAQG